MGSEMKRRKTTISIRPPKEITTKHTGRFQLMKMTFLFRSFSSCFLDIDLFLYKSLLFSFPNVLVGTKRGCFGGSVRADENSRTGTGREKAEEWVFDSRERERDRERERERD